MNTPRPQAAQGPGHTLLLILGATALTFALSFIPFASVLTYPIRLFSTFIHETGHILAALLTFGSVKSMTVHLDTSGLTYTAGGLRFAISSAGYVGTALFGALMLLGAHSERTARWALGLTGALILAVTGLFAGEGSNIPVFLGLGIAGAAGAVLFKRRTTAGLGLKLGLGALAGVALLGVTGWLLLTHGLLTWALGLTCGAALLAGAWFARERAARFLTAFLGVQVGLDALKDVFGLIGLSQIPHVHTDAVNMAESYGLHPIVWAVIWSVMSLVLVGGALAFLVVDWRRQAKRSNPA